MFCARSDLSRQPAHTYHLQQRGIVADWRGRGKRKVREGFRGCSHLLHNFSTATNRAVLTRKRGLFGPILPEISKHQQTRGES